MTHQGQITSGSSLTVNNNALEDWYARHRSGSHRLKRFLGDKDEYFKQHAGQSAGHQ